jgi:hypothetical protein
MPAWIVYVCLFALSWVHNELINLVHDETDGHNPWTAFFVVAGVLYTIAAAYLIDGEYINIWTLFFCYVASGTPMIIGDMVRYYRKGK